METKEKIISEIFRIKCSINDIREGNPNVEQFNNAWALERKQLERKTKVSLETLKFQMESYLLELQKGDEPELMSIEHASPSIIPDATITEQEVDKAESIPSKLDREDLITSILDVQGQIIDLMRSKNLPISDRVENLFGKEHMRTILSDDQLVSVMECLLKELVELEGVEVSEQEVDKAEIKVPTRSELEKDITELSKNVYEYNNGISTWDGACLNRLSAYMDVRSISGLIYIRHELEERQEEINERARQFNAKNNAPIMSDPESQLEKIELTPNGVKMHELTQAEFDHIHAEAAKIKETQAAIANLFFNNISHIVRNEIGKDWVMTSKSYKSITFTLSVDEELIQGANITIKRHSREENRYTWSIDNIRGIVERETFCRFYGNFAILIQEDEVMSQIADCWETYMTSYDTLQKEFETLKNSIC